MAHNRWVPTQLGERIRLALREQADPALAPVMFAYMKGIQPFLGVQTPTRRGVVRAALKTEPDRAARFAAALELWAGEFREERYAALDLLAASRPGPADLPFLEGLLPGADHWDLLDSLSPLLAQAFANDSQRRERVELWRVSPHLWTRRAAVLAQLKAKRTTDQDLLLDTIRAVQHEREFFIQKAIGWALREYAKTDPVWVLSAVETLGLTGLARREALKHLA
ncbi:DNA alkylation repair protein [Deinococcus oregonensis]|uniref:DNA alkylation repair protein n=1 Tax=Deinococcus oregonensis TaxID=1805970 RepID=A0ABV6AWX3_9DEIO